MQLKLSQTKIKKLNPGPKRMDYFDSKELIHWIDWSGRPGDKRLATFKNRENSIPKEVDELKEKLKESTGANTR